MDLPDHFINWLRDFFYSVIAYLHSIAVGSLNLSKFKKKKMVINRIYAVKLTHAVGRSKV